MGVEMGVVQALVLQAAGLAIGIVLSFVVLPFDILREGLKKVSESWSISIPPTYNATRHQ